MLKDIEKDIDSVLKIDKKSFPQAYLEQCKYKLKKRKRSRYIDHLEIIDCDSENDSENDSGSSIIVNDSSIDYVEIKEEIEILITS